MSLFPVDELEALLILKAANGQPISYCEVFTWFGHRFQRFQVGHLCAALTEVDRRQILQQQPELASLVVRQSDGLPGQGWWLSLEKGRWKGQFTGPKAAAFVRRVQKQAFDFWQNKTADQV